MAKNPEETNFEQPEHHLVVIHPFGDYKRGDIITEAAEIDTVKSEENAHHCHKVHPKI